MVSKCRSVTEVSVVMLNLTITTGQKQGHKPGPEVIKLFFMLNSAEHELLNAHKYENIKNFSIFQAQKNLECCFSCS